MILGPQFALINTSFACPLDCVVARRSAAVWRRRVKNCCVGSLLRLGRVGSPTWLSCCCSCPCVVVVRVVCCAVFFARVTIFLATLLYEPIRL